MFEILFYHDRKGKSEIEDFLNKLVKEAKTNKECRINKEKILAYLKALSEFGTRIGEPYVKHVENDIWELRPLKNRIFFFYWKDNYFVLLHHFVKKTQKTPPKEIAKARKNLKDFIERSEEK